MKKRLYSLSWAPNRILQVCMIERDVIKRQQTLQKVCWQSEYFNMVDYQRLFRNRSNIFLELSVFFTFFYKRKEASPASRRLGYLPQKLFSGKSTPNWEQKYCEPSPLNGVFTPLVPKEDHDESVLASYLYQPKIQGKKENICEGKG